MIKKYTANVISLSTAVLVNGVVQRIAFRGGHLYPYRKNGTFYTDDKALQEAMEASSGFGKSFFLEESDDVAEVATTEIDLQLVEDVDGFRAAQSYLVKEKGVALKDIKSKKQVIAKAAELGLRFSM